MGRSCEQRDLAERIRLLFFFFSKNSIDLALNCCMSHALLMMICVCVCSMMPKHEYNLRIHERVCATFYDTAALLACVYNVHCTYTQYGSVLTHLSPSFIYDNYFYFGVEKNRELPLLIQ